jgi:CRP-like cAMP-binding protein
MDAQAFLATVPLFAQTLDAAQLRSLAQQAHEAFFRSGTLLMSQGEFGGSMFAIVEGEVAVSFLDRRGKAREVARLKRGEVVGEMSLFTGDRRTATVSAVTNVTALEIGKTSLERLFIGSPGLLDRFSELLAARQADLAAISAKDRAASRDDFAHRAARSFATLFGGGARRSS